MKSSFDPVLARPGWVLCLVIVIGLSGHGVLAGGDTAVKEAAKAAHETFSTASFVAKMNLKNYGHHFVLADGSPAPQKSGKQGRGGEGALFAKDIKVRMGEMGEGIYVRAKKKEVIIQLTKKRKGINGTWVHILYDRPVVPADLEPAKLARAVSSVVTIQGFEAGADVAAAFDEALGGEPEVVVDTASTPMLASFNVRIEPPRISRGTETAVTFEYQVAADGGAAVTVVESRSLLFAGTPLPTFPAVERVPRGPGNHTSTYSQPIPASASVGIYEFLAKVCVEDQCIERRSLLEVSP